MDLVGQVHPCVKFLEIGILCNYHSRPEMPRKEHTRIGLILENSRSSAWLHMRLPVHLLPEVRCSQAEALSWVWSLLFVFTSKLNLGDLMKQNGIKTCHY